MGFGSSGFNSVGTAPPTQPLSTPSLAAGVNQGQGQLQNVQAGQNQLAQALLQQSQGGGPNPAQMLTQQATQGAIAQNQGMIASQKGISPALAQRLGAQNAAQMSQQAAGQGALNQANQQLASQQALQGNLNAQGQQAISSIGTQGQLANQSGLGVEGINAGLQAQANAANQNMFGGLLQGIGTAGAMAAMSDGGSVDESSGADDPNSWAYSLQHAFDPPEGTQHNINDQKFLQTSSNDSTDTQSKANGGTVSSDEQLANFQADQQTFGQKAAAQKISSPLGSGGSSPNDASSQIANKMLSSAGVNMMPAGGTNSAMGSGIASLGNAAGTYLSQPSSSPGADQEFQNFDNSQSPSVSSQNMPLDQNTTQTVSTGGPGASEGFAKGGKIMPPHLHAIASIYHPHMVQQQKNVPMPEKNMPSTVAALKAVGGKVPGKAKRKGDHKSNDTVPTMLSPGEMVIPKSVMESQDPAQGAADFVAKHLREKGMGDEHGDFKEALKAAVSSRRTK